MREFSVHIDVGHGLTASSVEEAEATLEAAADEADKTSSVVSAGANGWCLQTIVDADTEDEAREKAQDIMHAVAAASGLPSSPVTGAGVTDPISPEEMEALLAAARAR